MRLTGMDGRKFAIKFIWLWLIQECGLFLACILNKRKYFEKGGDRSNSGESALNKA